MKADSLSFETSRAAYEWCVENAVISQRVADVLKVLVDAVAPMNQTIAHLAVVRSTGNATLSKYSVSPRFAVLERMGLIREVGAGPCPISGRSTVFYEATNARPSMTEAAAMKSGDHKETLRALKEQVKELTHERNQLREMLEIRSESHRVHQVRMKAAKVAIQTEFLCA